MAKGRNKFFLIRILELLTRRIKTKVIFFEVFIILFISVLIGVIITFYMSQTLTEKAHQFSERIVRDLAKSIEYNYDSMPAVGEDVNSYNGSEGIMYLGYHGYILSKKVAKPSKVHIFIGQDIQDKSAQELDPIFKELSGFQMSKETAAYSREFGTVVADFAVNTWNNIVFNVRKNILKEKIPGQSAQVRKELQYFEYYMPVVVKTGATTNKKIGNIVMRYSVSIIKSEIERMALLIEIITGVFIIIGVYLSVRGANGIVRPITRLTDIVKKFGEGDLTVRANMPVKDEIGTLAKTFDEMMVSIREKLEMQKFVSDSTVKMIKKSVNENQPSHDKEKHTERKQVTLFFSDIRGFTAMSEKMDPQDVVNILNEYLDVQSNIIKVFKGDIDKFVGDEIVAIFESGTMCVDAVSAAIEAQRKIAGLNRDRIQKGLAPVQIGIGINTGEVVMGSIGSHERMDFTVIGDNVNLAARLCGAAIPGEIIISKRVYDKLDKNTQKLIRPLRPIHVKGKVKPIEVYRVEY